MSLLSSRSAITKVQAIIIAAIIVIAAIVAAVYYVTRPPAPTPTAEIAVLAWTDAWNEYVKSDLVPDFEEETGIEVTYDIVGWDVVYEKMVTELSGATGAYDVMTMGEDWALEWVKNGWFTNLTALWEENPDILDPDYDYDDFDSAAVVALTIPGEPGVWGIPCFTYSWYLAYRTDLFEQAGLDPPNTWGNFTAALQKFGKEKWRAGIYAYTAPMLRGYETLDNWYTWVHALGGEYLKDLRVDPSVPWVNTPVGREAVDLMKKLADDYAPPGLLTAGYWEGSLPYLEGDAAMLNNYVDFSFLAVYGDPDYEDLINNTGYVVPPPRGDDGRYGGLTYVSGYDIPVASQNKEAAWQFIQYVTSKENMEPLAEFGAPVRTSVIEDPEVQATFPWMSTTLENLEKATAIWPKVLGLEPWSETLQREIHLALAGTKTVEAAMETAQKEVCAILQATGEITWDEYYEAYDGWTDNDGEPRLVLLTGINGTLPDGYRAWETVL